VSPPKLVLAVIDALKPSMLERAIETGQAPALKAVMDRGAYVRDCVSAFPSVTPTCAASITTGATPDQHRIPSMNWYHRGERRYVEYGSSFQATRTFGILRSLTDTVYNMNLAHLSKDVETVFETLDDADVRTAGTTYLIYRGRHRHEVSNERALTRLATATAFRHAVWGPRELFYADLFASRKTGCFSQLGLPGLRDQHSGCVGAHLVREDLFDFLLLSLPDNDTRSHKLGPHAQVQSIHDADRQLERLFHAAGGADAFLEEHAVIVMGDHSQSAVEDRIRLVDALDEDYAVLRPADRDPAMAELAVCPASRAAMVYVLDPDRRDELVRPLAERSLALTGVEIAAWMEGDEAVVVGEAGELRFAPGGDLEDLRGERWSAEGDLAVLRLDVQNGGVWSADYPDALARLWASLANPTAGDVQLSAAPGYEFTDWGGADHVGGGSHGSLHRNDSHGALLWCGTGPEDASARTQWTIRDAAAMTLEHFGATPGRRPASVSSGA
jgi:predicted AlkP superfamily pyrophosphatase or phosphodiesterase